MVRRAVGREAVGGAAVEVVVALKMLVLLVLLMMMVLLLLHLLVLEMLLVVEGSLFVDLDSVCLCSPVLEPDLVCNVGLGEGGLMRFWGTA